MLTFVMEISAKWKKTHFFINFTLILCLFSNGEFISDKVVQSALVDDPKTLIKTYSEEKENLEKHSEKEKLLTEIKSLRQELKNFKEKKNEETQTKFEVCLGLAEIVSELPDFTPTWVSFSRISPQEFSDRKIAAHAMINT